MDFLIKMFTDPSVFGSIIGGLIGGIFTYLAVILTIKSQDNDALPNKLVNLAKMSIQVQKQLEELAKDSYLVKERRYDFNEIRDKFDLNPFQDNIGLQAILVDKDTYKRVLSSFVKYKEYNVDRLSPDSKLEYVEAVELLNGLRSFLDELLEILFCKIKEYEKKIK